MKETHYKLKHRVTALFAAAVMLCSMLPGAAFAEEPTPQPTEETVQMEQQTEPSETDNGQTDASSPDPGEDVTEATPETAEEQPAEEEIPAAVVGAELYTDLPNAPIGSYIGSEGLPVATGETKIGICEWPESQLEETSDSYLTAAALDNDGLTMAAPLLDGADYAIVPIMAQVEYPADGSSTDMILPDGVTLLDFYGEPATDADALLHNSYHETSAAVMGVYVQAAADFTAQLVYTDPDSSTQIKTLYVTIDREHTVASPFADKHNLNIIVIGGSGSGKTRFYVKPNALQLIGSYLFLDPKGELTRTLGRIMETKGISVTVLDLVHFQGHYNPMAYLETDEDAIKLAFAIVNNTKPKDAPSGGDKFWDDSSVLLISALILYLMYEAPASEQNFSTLMYMILNCQVSENEMVENPLMMLFGELERRDPQHPAVLQFKSFMLGAKKTLQSILISAAANLYMFNSRKFAEMTSRDEMFLPRMGLEQRALFIVLPDNDTTFNFIATMLYTQLFDQLFRLADSTPEYNGALPVHVRLMMDEFANVALPKNFKNILAVCRSRNISCDIILQNIAQLKSLFKDDWEGIIGNCDTLLYLGGNEYGTYEYLSKILGKETERTKSQSIGKGSRGSSSDSLQTAGRELCMPDEIRRMLDDECLLLMRSEDPVIDRKYNLLKHPNVKYTPDAGGEPYVIPPDYMGDAITITMGAVAAATAPEITEEMYEQLDYLEKHPEENYYENEENFSQYDQGD